MTDENKVLDVFAQVRMLTYKMEPMDKLIDQVHIHCSIELIFLVFVHIGPLFKEPGMESCYFWASFIPNLLNLH